MESFAQRLGKDKQAVTLAVSDVQGVARLVVPGDHVNLMLTTDKAGLAPTARRKRSSSSRTSRCWRSAARLLYNPVRRRPLAAADVAAGQAKTVDSGLMTFAVPGLDAERIVNASQTGSIHLTLVPPDYAPAPIPPVNRGNLFS